MESYSPFCKHCLGVSVNEIGETIVFCEEWDLWRNVTLAECFGNCEDQEVIDGTEPWEWKEPPKGGKNESLHQLRSPPIVGCREQM